MTIWTPPISEVGAAVQARNFRKAFSAFINGEGLLKATDLQVTGDPSLLKVNISTGGAMLLLPDGTFDVINADAVEVRTLNSAPTSGGARLDLIYAGMQSEEFGDGANLNDIRYKANPSPGSLTLPTPDTMAGVYPLATVSVPIGATKGTDCTITMLSATTAPVRDGGFTSGDLAGGGLPVVSNQTVHFGSTGTASTNHGAPFTPSMVIPVPTGPINAGPYVLLHAVSTISATTFASQWVMSDNSIPTVGSVLQVRVVAFP